jgi:hypothetical protein
MALTVASTALMVASTAFTVVSTALVGIPPGWSARVKSRGSGA